MEMRKNDERAVQFSQGFSYYIVVEFVKSKFIGAHGLPLMISASMLTMEVRSLMIRVLVGA